MVAKVFDSQIQYFHSGQKSVTVIMCHDLEVLQGKMLPHKYFVQELSTIVFDIWCQNLVTICKNIT